LIESNQRNFVKGGFCPGGFVLHSLTRRPGLRERAHPFKVLLKDDKQMYSSCPILILASSSPALGFTSLCQSMLL